MALRAQYDAHKDALRRLSDIVFENKDKLSEQAFLEVSNLQKKLHDTAAQMIHEGTVAQGETRQRVPASPLDGEISDSDHNGSDSVNAHILVRQYERGDVSPGWLVGVLAEAISSIETKATVGNAICALVAETSEELGTERQTVLGQQGAIQALATWITCPSLSLVHSAMTTLTVLVRRHDGNQSILGQLPGAIAAITHHMREGSVPTEKLAIALLSVVGFQHDANQQIMNSAGTVEAIVHLLGHVRPLSCHERVLKLMHKLMCSLGMGAPPLAKVAVDAGIVPILLNQLDSRLQVDVLDVLYRIIDDNEDLRDRVVEQGGIQRVAVVLLNSTNAHESRTKAARVLGEMGGRSFRNRAVMRELGVIPILKELLNEPSGRSRNSLSFVLSRVDEEGGGIAASEARRREVLERELQLQRANAKRREDRRKERQASHSRAKDGVGPPKSPRKGAQSARAHPEAAPPSRRVSGSTRKATKAIDKSAKRARK